MRPDSCRMKLRLANILLLLSFALRVSADNLGYTEDNPLIFGIDMDYAPMEYVDDDGIPHGLDVEFTKKLMKRLHLPFTYAPNTWENIAGDVLHGKVDLGMMVYSPYRKDITNYSRAVFRLYYQIVYRKTDPTPYGLRDVKGKDIAFMDSRPIADTLRKIGANLIVVKNLQKTLKELSDGKYDAVICFRYQVHHHLKELDIDNLGSSDLALMPREYCYVSNNKRLIDAINAELDKMEEEGIIEDVYGNIKTTFGGLHIPMWVWLLVAGLIIYSLLSVIIIQRRGRKRLQAEMERARESEQKARENEQRAIKSEELKGIFLSNISHALRTPLNAIIGFSDLMLTTAEGMPQEEQQQLLGLINNNGLQLLHLINELMSLSEIEDNQSLFDREVTDVDHEMSTYAGEIRMQLREGVELEVIEPIGGIRALVDPKLLRMVTMHLLDNAMQHTEKGKIMLNYFVKEGGLYVEVKDTGCGLPEKLKDNIFALLSDKNTYVQDETPGLGLSICKAVIDRVGGKIGASDNKEDGHGTVVWFWTPLEILN